MSLEARQYVLPELPAEQSNHLGGSHVAELQEMLASAFAGPRNAAAHEVPSALPFDERLVRVASRASGFGLFAAAILAVAWLMLRH